MTQQGYAQSNLTKIDLEDRKDNLYIIERFLKHGETKTRVTNNLVIDCKIMYTEYREDEEVQENWNDNRDVLDTAVVRMITYNKKNDYTQDYYIHISLAENEGDTYDVCIRQNNQNLVHDVYDSAGGSVMNDCSATLAYKDEFGDDWEEIQELVEDILFSYSVDHDKKIVTMGLINPF